jgi:hypothetical protein
MKSRLVEENNQKTLKTYGTMRKDCPGHQWKINKNLKNEPIQWQLKSAN